MPDNNSEQLFAQLDDVRLDPYTMRVMTQAAEIEALINDDSETDELTSITIADLSREAIEKMDTECPHFGEPVLVAGRLKQAYYDEIEEKFGLEDVEVDRAVLISHGYTILEFGMDGANRPIKKVGHLLLRQQMEPQNDTPALVDYVPRLFAFAPVGQVRIEYDLGDQENNEDLQKIIPDVLDDIDSRLLNATDECTALLSLGDMVISESQDIPGSVLSALVSYVNKKLAFDKAIPYTAQFYGLAYEDRPDRELKAHFILYQHDIDNEAESVIVSPDRLSLRRSLGVADDGTITFSDGELHWCIDLTVQGRDADSLGRNVSVPVENILSFQSVREMLFGDSDTVQ